MSTTKCVSVKSGGTPPGPDSTCAENNSSFLLEALEKMLDSRFSKLESRLCEIESKFKDIDEKIVIHSGNSIFKSSDLSSLSTEMKGDPFDKSLNNVASEKQVQKSQIPSDNFVNECLSSIKTEIVDSLSSLDNKMSEFSLVLEKQEESISSIHKRIENIVPEEEIRNLVPKIVQLQTNLDFLLAGESETNALIDNVIPTINKLQKDIENFTASQKGESTKLNEELFPKIQKSLGEIYDKTKDVKCDVIDNRELVHDKSSKMSKSVEDLKHKMSRLEEKVIRLSPPERSRSKDNQTRSASSSRRSKNYQSEDHRSGRDGSYRKSIDSDSDSDHDKSKSASTNDDLNASKEIRSQLLSISRGIEHLEKEIRKVDIVDIIEERVIPNIYSIRKSIEQAAPTSQSPVSPVKKFDPASRNYYGKYQDDQTGRKRFPPEYHRNSRGRGRGLASYQGTKWTYDEHGKREPLSDNEADDAYRSRSPKRRSSRSRSRDSESADRSKDRRKKAKERSSSPDSEDGEIQIMERTIEKISIAVVEIQDKMDSWLKYSKKTLAKSDENTGNLMEKLSNNSSVIITMNSKIESLPETLEKLIESEMNIKNSIRMDKAIEDSELKGKCILDVQSRLGEFNTAFERHFSDLSNKIDSTVGKSTSKAEEVITTTLLHRLDDLISRTKKNDSYIKSNNENTAKIFSLLKKIESAEKAILNEMQKNLSTFSNATNGEGSLKEISKCLQEVSPRLHDLYVKILPVLDEIKTMQKKSFDKKTVERREDSEHIQKILDLVEDIKEEKKLEPLSLPTDNNMLQVFNALNDLKITMNSKETHTSKIINELKTDNTKMQGRISDINKVTKSSEKLNHKVHSILEELRKNNATDAKTISQMNTVLQGIKASGPAYENKVLNSLKDLKETLTKSVTELPTIEYITPLLKSEDDFFSGQFQSLKKLIEELIDKVNLDESQNMQQLLDSTQTIILEMFSKELKKAEKNILEIGTSLEGHLEKNEARNTQVLSEMDEGFKFRFDQVESYLNTQFKDVDQKIKDISDVCSAKTIIGTTKKNNKKGEQHFIGVDFTAKLSEIEKKMLSEKEFKSLMDELSKYQKLSSEILNSVEDLKILTSSTPTAIHEIVPKIEKIHSIILDIPNEFLTAMAATEENLCLNLDAKMKDQHQLTLQEIFDKFDHMDSRMAVIKKYAKHGPLPTNAVVQLSSSSSTPAPSTHSQGTNNEEQKQDPQQQSPNVESNSPSVIRQMGEMKSFLIEELSSIKDIKISLDSFQSSLIPMVEDVRTLDKQIFQEQAKGIVVEDQLEALCNTLLQPIQKLGCGEDLMVPQNNDSLCTSLLNSLEDKQIQCLDLLDSFSNAVKTAVEAAICPQILGGGNGNRADSLEKEARQRFESINKLIAYFKKVQDLETDIISKCDRSIELQAQLNEHLNSVVPNVDRVRSLLEGLTSPVCDTDRDKSFDALDTLCEDIVQHLKGINELSHKSSEPRSQSIDELKEFVQLSVSVMERLLKEDDNEETQNCPPPLVINNSDFAAHEHSDENPTIMDTNIGDIQLGSSENRATTPSATATTPTTIITNTTAPLPVPPVQSSKDADTLLSESSNAPAPLLAENPFFENPEVKKKSRKRKLGPKSCVPNYVDEGPMVVEDEGNPFIKEDSIKFDSSLPLNDQSLQPVVKLVKTHDKVAPLRIKKSKLMSSVEPPELTVIPPNFSPSMMKKSTTDLQQQQQSMSSVSNINPEDAQHLTSSKSPPSPAHTPTPSANTTATTTTNTVKKTSKDGVGGKESASKKVTASKRICFKKEKFDI
ncbi:unnamed protein product [Lepeophtheirus salmonis]|uniref:(salmon louse) hypothetical protein n=1 Tax=Lepeophtheirus salmonis TaxID=72036 RepID=A0A7R8H369_LEPSM|nr:unnamed protein product [Lepeophtheirus salmonis]CAF2841568.1 unnamed protein product [Lepeophtheirus salmonis]